MFWQSWPLMQAFDFAPQQSGSAKMARLSDQQSNASAPAPIEKFGSPQGYR